MDEIRELQLNRSKGGLPCLWESGGGMTNTGNATIIANADGSAPRAIFIPTRGSLANEKHALIPIKTGMYVITANHHRRDFDIYVERIVEIKDDSAYLERAWPIPGSMISAMEAAMAKATDYHCRSVYWAYQ